MLLLYMLRMLSEAQPNPRANLAYVTCEFVVTKLTRNRQSVQGRE